MKWLKLSNILMVMLMFCMSPSMRGEHEVNRKNLIKLILEKFLEIEEQKIADEIKIWNDALKEMSHGSSDLFGMFARIDGTGYKHEDKMWGVIVLCCCACDAGIPASSINGQLNLLRVSCGERHAREFLTEEQRSILGEVPTGATKELTQLFTEKIALLEKLSYEEWAKRWLNACKPCDESEDGVDFFVPATAINSDDSERSAEETTNDSFRGETSEESVDGSVADDNVVIPQSSIDSSEVSEQSTSGSFDRTETGSDTNQGTIQPEVDVLGGQAPEANRDVKAAVVLVKEAEDDANDACPPSAKRPRLF